MRPRAALPVLLAGLLAGGLLPAVATAPFARPTSVTARLAPPVVTVGEPTGLVAQVSPVRTGRTVTLQGTDGTSWFTMTTASTDSRGRTFFPLPTDTAGRRTLRVVAAATGRLPRRVSTPVTLSVRGPAQCTPTVAPVDPAATVEARCLAKRLDRWKAAGLMGVGQQLNVSNRDYLAPLTELGTQRVSVVGFDVGELADGETYSFADPPLQNLLRLAQEGAVLTASWHAPNPHTGRPSGDRTWHDLAALLDDATPEAQAFWTDFDRMLPLFLRLQSGDGGLHPPAAVVFRPFHEANGGWFWWGRPSPDVYRAVWAKMQARAEAAGVHNVLWAYSFAARTGSWVMHPEKLVPGRVDVAGIDSYDPEGGDQGADRFDLSGYAEVAARVSRMAITEAGPHGSAAGDWNPSVITRTVRVAGIKPTWAMLWFDDGTGEDGVTGRKQLGSLQGGPAWLRSCANALCYLR